MHLTLSLVCTACKPIHCSNSFSKYLLHGKKFSSDLQDKENSCSGIKKALNNKIGCLSRSKGVMKNTQQQSHTLGVLRSGELALSLWSR